MQHLPIHLWKQPAPIKNPFETTNFLFALTFEWVTSFIWKGYKKPLELEDVPELPSGDKIENSYKSFSQAYDTQKHRSRFVAVAAVIFKTIQTNYLDHFQAIWLDFLFEQRHVRCGSNFRVCALDV